MINILSKIVSNRKNLIKREKEILSADEMSRLVLGIRNSGYKPAPFTANYSEDRCFLIAEIKKSSPSLGVIRHDFNPAEIAAEYERSGEVDAVSVLTEPTFFSGCYPYIETVKRFSSRPVLMKDFILEEFQVFAGYIAGASAILLIMSVLRDSEIRNLIKIAHSLDMAVLLETHSLDEYKKAGEYDAELIGINNRNLRDFTVSIDNTIKILNSAGRHSGRIIISESGIKTSDDIKKLYENNVDGVLIGELLMKSSSPEKMLRDIRRFDKDECSKG